MKQSQVKALVEMIVRRTFAEMHDSYSVDSTNMVTLNGIQLPDGRKVSANIGIDGEWDTGGFGYEYGMEKGTHHYPAQFEFVKWDIEQVIDEATNAVIPLTPELAKLIDAEMESIADEVAEKINENPPE